MATPKIFAGTDANIRLTIDTDPLSANYAGFGLADIDDLVVVAQISLKLDTVVISLQLDTVDN